VPVGYCQFIAVYLTALGQMALQNASHLKDPTLIPSSTEIDKKFRKVYTASSFGRA
jgi:hypothetical protein